MPTATATIEPAARPAKAAGRQMTFEWLLGEQQMFSILDIARLTNMSCQFWEDAYDAGTISGHRFNGRGAGKRWTKRIPREYVVAALIESADYDMEMRRGLIFSIIDNIRSKQELLELAAHARERAGKL